MRKVGCGNTTEIESVGIKERQREWKGHRGYKGSEAKGWGKQEEEMRRSSGEVEGRASQVSTFLSIFHQAG